MLLGHSGQIDMFRRSIDTGRLNHAYILSGIEGIGKKTFAINIAKSLFCKNGSFFTECHCDACIQSDMLTYPDLYLINKKDILIDNIRSIVSDAGLTALAGVWKVFIIDGAEAFSQSGQSPAANALLKTLEEPAENTLFFLITDNYYSILPTIRSRAALIKFNRLKNDDIIKIVSEKLPGVPIKKEIIELAGGSAGKALSLMAGDFADVTDYLKRRDFIGFSKCIFSLKESSAFESAIISAYPFLLAELKSTGNYEILQLGYYMLDILKRLNYNANADLIRADFVSKVIEVFSETV